MAIWAQSSTLYIYHVWGKPDLEIAVKRIKKKTFDPALVVIFFSRKTTTIPFNPVSIGGGEY